MNKLMLTCKEMSFISSKELDTKLPLITRVKLVLHIAMCKTCFRYRHQLKIMHSLIQRIAPEFDTLSPDRPVELSDESKERIKKYLSEQLKK